MKSRVMAEKGKHLPLWEEVKIYARKELWRIGHLKEQHMLDYTGLLNRSNTEKNTIREPITKKG